MILYNALLVLLIAPSWAAVTVTPERQEAMTGIAVTVTCVILGHTEAAAVVWSTAGEADLDGVSGYTVDIGSYTSTTVAQDATLVLDAATNTEGDKTFTCAVTPVGGNVIPKTVTVTHFGTYSFIWLTLTRLEFWTQHATHLMIY